jgi:hypothetical protein
VYLVTVLIVAQSVSFAVLYGFMHKSLAFKVAWLSIGKCVFGAFVTAGVLLVLPQTTTVTTTFGKMLVGVVVYSGLLNAIDADARKLVRQIWEEITGTVRPNGSAANL